MLGIDNHFFCTCLLKVLFIHQPYVKYPLPTFCFRESLHSFIYLLLMIIANVKHSLLMV